MGESCEGGDKPDRLADDAFSAWRNGCTKAKKHGHELGVEDDEVAFYDALAKSGTAEQVMKSVELRLMARKLAKMVGIMPKLDWTQRESVRADLRRKVRRLLALYGYPPDLSEDATHLVLKQASFRSTPNDLAISSPRLRARGRPSETVPSVMTNSPSKEATRRT